MVNSVRFKVKPVAVCPAGMVSEGWGVSVSSTGAVVSGAGLSVTGGVSTGWVEAGGAEVPGVPTWLRLTRGTIWVATIHTAARITARERTVRTILDTGHLPKPPPPPGEARRFPPWGRSSS